MTFLCKVPSPLAISGSGPGLEMEKQTGAFDLKLEAISLDFKLRKLQYRVGYFIFSVSFTTL